MLRIVIRVLLGLVLLATAGLAGIRGWAVLREDRTAVDAAGPGALFVPVDGLDLHFREWGRPDGPPILIVPGTLAWAETFRDIAVPLGEQGFRVIALDLPPFGYSERPADRDYSRAAQARRILGFADQMKLDRFALAVHSQGGGAALEAAFQAPGRIEALVLLDVALRLGRPHVPPPLAPLLGVAFLRDTLVAATFSNPLMLPVGLRDFVHDDALVTAERTEIYQRPLAVQGTTSAIGDWLTTGLFGDETGSRSAREASYTGFDRPVLVIWGAQDTVTPLDQGQRLAALFPRAELAVLDGVNHIPQVEKPADVVRLVGDFLRRQSGKSDRLQVDADLRGGLGGG
jgi:pimeloyl-ACP methyl ester carboxylesterase